MFRRRQQFRIPGQRDALMQKIRRQIFAVQCKLATWMQHRTRNWTKRQKMIFLFLLCLLLGGMSIYRVVDTFDSKKEVDSVKLIRQQPLPLIIPAAPDPLPVVIDTAAFRRFRRDMDSLMKTPEGRIRYHQFKKQRPGFMDSLTYIEKLTKQSFPTY